MTDPLTAQVSDMSRLAARLVPHNQQGHRTAAAQGEVSGLVSGLKTPVGSLVDETDGALRTVLQRDAGPGLLDLDDESVGDSTAEVVTPLVGNLMKGTAAIMDAPGPRGVRCLRDCRAARPIRSMDWCDW